MSSEELGLPSFLVGDVLIRHPDLAGLDSPAELFAVDTPEAQSAPRWGVFWAAAFRDAPPLPTSVRAQLPEEGGFVVRPLTQPMPASVLRVEGRCLQAPRREVHAELGFPEPALVSNEVFAEVRYGLAPSVVQRLDFEDIREGTLRLFAIPGFEGDVRVVTLVDELAAKEVLAQIHHELTGGLHRKRLLEFLHAAAASPAAAKWPSSSEVTSGDFVESLLQRPVEPELRHSIPEGELFPHQVATVAWMQQIERQGRQSLQVEPFHFAGATLGSAYELQLPMGGVVAHPPGSGKTRIVASLAAASERSAAASPGTGAVAAAPVPATEAAPSEGRRWRWDDWLHYFCPCGVSLQPSAQTPEVPGNASHAVPRRLKTLIVAPAHLLRQWREELAGQNSLESEVMDYEEASELMSSQGWRRLVIDEPQDCPGSAWSSLQRLADEFREAGVAVWQLCGTAKSQLDSIGPLLLGWKGWHVAWRQSEWTGFPQLAHLIRTRFLADPPWACLPRPRLEWHNEGVVLRPRESTDVGVANLAGFVLDSVLLLSFGAGMAFAAAQERDQLLAQMGWYSCVGTSLLPMEEHALADWEGTVQSRTKQKLEKLQKEIGKLEASESQQGLRYQLAAGDAALAPDLSFLSVETVRVSIEGLEETQACAGAAAEWNALLPSQSYRGALVSGRAQPGVVLLRPETVDFGASCAEAEALGAVAVIFAAERGAERPFGYRHDRAPPGIPACMVSCDFAQQLFRALEQGSPLEAEVMLLAQESHEDDRDLEEGMVSAFIANDAVDTTLHRQLKALRGERERCERSLRFARQMRHLLERNEAHCPVCFATGKEAEAFAVLPDCFHILCRGCLEQQAGMEPTFGCPMCRTSVFRLDVVVFKSPGIEAIKTEESEDRSRSPPSRAAGEASYVASLQQREVLPSKLQRLLSLLQELLASGPEERILVYTQWATHVVYLQDVLQQQGILSLALVGELRETMDVLSRFGCHGEPRVLLLSSQRHSSGINLQMARHVVIVHPYCTPTATSQESISRLQMLAFEAQAIGRVRRYPQKKTVHVHRLFAVGSVEEELYAR